MLGAISGHRRGWSFYARGKHPAARDFVTLGQESRLAVGLSHWLEQGFAHLSRPGAGRLYRLWVRGQGPGELALGLILDSRDLIGRHHPLLILGQGSLPGWEENWELLTLVLEESWSGMVQLAGADYGSFAVLERGFLGLKPPRESWREARALLEAPGECGDEELLPTWSGIRPILPGREEPEEIEVAAASDAGGTLAARVRLLTREAGLSRPALAFLGGTPGHYHYRMYHRALKGSDFTRLWRPEAEEAG